VVIRWRATVQIPAAAAQAGCLANRGRSGISVLRLLAGKQVDSHTGYTNDAREGVSAA
jgi:hypothetical protein